MDGRPTPYAELARMSDAGLIAHARAHHAEVEFGFQTAKTCVALVFERHRALVRAHCAAKAPPGDVEDLEQQVYLRFVRAVYRQTAPMVNPAGLLVKMTRNVIASFHAKPRPDVEPLDETSELAATGDTYDELAVSEAVEDLLAVLDERQRDVVWAKVMEGLPAAEIARRLDTTSGNVDVIYCRALKRLREVVER